jgi:type II secretory pathway component GspD/PulD (secretin)
LTSSPIVAETVSFVDVGMKLYVTPTIGDDGYITMKIRPEVSSVDRILRTSQNNPIPIVRTSESETTVMVKDGITITIAGLIEEREINKVEGVPLLCKIPILGYLFTNTSKQKEKTELVIFLTPRIMTGDVLSEEKEKTK